MAILVGASAAQLCVLVALLCNDAALATIHRVQGPGENSSLVCNQTWVAWTNESEPYYRLLPGFATNASKDSPYDCSVYECTFYLQVLSGSMPIIPVEYFEEGENGSLGRPVICRNPPTPPSPPVVSNRDDGTAIIVVVYVTSSLSIIASLVALFTFLLIPRLRTLSGLVIMNLFLSFLLGEAMLQIRVGFEYNGKRLLVNAALGQGLLMSRFIWMSIAGFEMCRSLYRGTKMKLNSRQQKRVLLAVYMIIGWGMSAVLTIVMGVAEAKGGEVVRKYLGIVGYLTNYGTVGLLQLVNIIAIVFISTIIISAAKRQRRLSEKKVTKSQVNYARLLMVLLTVLGVVWLLFGIFAALPLRIAQKPEVLIPFIICTDTQPVFVCIAFVCTPKAFRMVMKKLHIPLPETKSGKRRGTVSFSYNSSNGERRLERRTTTQTSLTSLSAVGNVEKMIGLERGQTQTSIIRLPSVEIIPSPPLKPIEEEEEEEEEEEVRVMVEEKRELKTSARKGCAREIAKKNGAHPASNGVSGSHETVVVVIAS